MVTVTDQLDRYWANEMGCSLSSLYQGGVSVCAPGHREEPRWMGWIIPLLYLSLDRADPGTGVASVSPPLHEALSRFLANDIELNPPTEQPFRDFCRYYLPHGNLRLDRVLHCSPDDFSPAPEVYPISELDEYDVDASWYRIHFNGPIFVARNERGHIVSWAAIKIKADNVWEMAVVTEPKYRCRGLARSVVSQATSTALQRGNVALYLHALENIASSRVCTSLGYRPYGYAISCECGRVPPLIR